MNKRGKKYVEVSEERGRERYISQGITSEIAGYLNSSFIIPFAELMKASASQIGYLSAFAGLLAPLGSMRGSKLMEKYSRKKIHLRYTALQVIVTIFMLVLVAFVWKNILGTWLPYLLIIFYSLFVYYSGAKDPATFSWIGDIVPEKERGKYFAKRNRIVGVYGLGVFILASLMMRYFESKNIVLIGFVILFILSALFRLISYYQVKKIYSPSFRLHKSDEFSLWSFLRRYDNFGKFTVFLAVYNFAIMIASPFFAVYMLKELNFNILTFSIVSISSTVFYLLFTPMAGRFSDKYGNLKLLYVAAFVFPIGPIFWMFLKDPIFLILIPGLTAGIANAALSMGVTNYTYDSVRPEKRGIISAYMSMLSGVGVFVGSLAGGFMIDYLPIHFMKPILFVFLVAAILRLSTALYFLPKLEEPRKIRRASGLKWDMHHPFRTIHTDVVWFKKFVKAK